MNTFSSFFNKIYAQRGDTIQLLPTKQLNSTTYFNLTVAEADELIASTILSGTQRTLGAYDMWFVDSIEGGRAGRGALGGDGIVVSDDIIAINRVDTPAHELGHNIGFSHTNPKATDADRFLMAAGSIRTIPQTLGDIAPDGRQLKPF